MPHWILAPMTASLRYRTLLALALIGFGMGVVASLIWVYVLYSGELANYDLRVIAIPDLDVGPDGSVSSDGPVRQKAN